MLRELEIVLLKKLSPILHCKWTYILLVILALGYSFLFFLLPHHSILDISTNTLQGIITDMKIEGDLLTIQIEAKEKVLGNYYFKEKKEKENFSDYYHLGDTILVTGTFSKPKNNTVPNLFNYRKYLERKGIYYLISIDTIEKVKENHNPLYLVKTVIQNHISTYQSKGYLMTFILGDHQFLDQDIKTTYQEIGVSHLLAISGMHISLLSGIFLFFLKKMIKKENICYIITVFFLIFYMFLTGNSPSVSRAVILFSLLTCNQLLKWNLKTIQIWCLTFTILVFQNPNLLLEVGFQFSFIVSFYLILLQSKFKNKSYWHTLFFVSIISFSVSFPITIFHFYQVNILSVIFNFIFVPFISCFIFPFSLLTFFFPFLDSIFLFFLRIMENLALFCNHFTWSKLIWVRPSILWIFLYYVILTLFFYKKKKRILIIFFLLLSYQYFYLFLFPNQFLIMIDVGQGDSIFIHSNNHNLLIDTGGKISYPKEEWQERKTSSLAENTLLPLLKSLGIRKLDYLLLSHGDYDHMGEAKYLVNNFKVEKVIFNDGEYNDLELELIELLKNNGIPYGQKLEKISLGNISLYFLNTKIYDNENDNSNVIYTMINGKKLLLMGDAGIEKEKDILQKYNLYDIDILKVGHHGSKTSSSKEFINKIHPKYSLISVGANNRYGHPNSEVLDRLNQSKIFRTDFDGSIVLKFKNNQLNIKNYEP